MVGSFAAVYTLGLKSLDFDLVCMLCVLIGCDEGSVCLVSEIGS